MDAKEAAAEIKGLSAQFFSGAYVTPKWGVFTKNLESIIQQAIDSRVAELEVMLIGLAKDFEGACNYTDAPCNPRDSRWYAMWQDGEFVHDDNVQSLFAAIGMKDARIAELEAALKPFADYISHYDETDAFGRGYCLTDQSKQPSISDHIKAAKALKGGAE